MDIPSPDVVLLEAQYEDPYIDSEIESLGLHIAIKHYRGEPIYWRTPDDMVGHKYSSWFMKQLNFRLNQKGWKVDQIRDGNLRLMLRIDRYVPPSIFATRLGRAIRVLLGKE